MRSPWVLKGTSISLRRIDSLTESPFSIVNIAKSWNWHTYTLQYFITQSSKAFKLSVSQIGVDSALPDIDKSDSSLNVTGVTAFYLAERAWSSLEPVPLRWRLRARSFIPLSNTLRLRDEVIPLTPWEAAFSLLAWKQFASSFISITPRKSSFTNCVGLISFSNQRSRDERYF